jgi:hypothetical protein
MFADWIPEVLAEIEALGRLPNRPTGLALTTARQKVANLPPGRSRPSIRLWESPEGNGIYIEWEGSQIHVGWNGCVLVFG